MDNNSFIQKKQNAVVGDVILCNRENNECRNKVRKKNTNAIIINTKATIALGNKTHRAAFSHPKKKFDAQSNI